MSRWNTHFRLAYAKTDPYFSPSLAKNRVLSRKKKGEIGIKKDTRQTLWWIWANQNQSKKPRYLERPYPDGSKRKTFFRVLESFCPQLFKRNEKRLLYKLVDDRNNIAPPDLFRRVNRFVSHLQSLSVVIKRTLEEPIADTAR